jgi:cell division protein FtsW
VIIGEELGLLGALLVVAAFVGFAVLGVRVAVAAPDLFGTLMAGGITAWILVQAFINIGGVIGIMPITGVPLPFISYGGTSLITLMASSGVLLNIARQGRTRRPRPTAAEAVSVG